MWNAGDARLGIGMVFDGIARTKERLAWRRAASGAFMLALFVFGVWLAPALHRAHCDDDHAVSHAAEPHSCEDTADSNEPCEDSGSAPARHRPDNCPLCKLAKAPMAPGILARPSLPFVPSVSRPLAEPAQPRIGRTPSSRKSRAPPAFPFSRAS